MLAINRLACTVLAVVGTSWAVPLAVRAQPTPPGSCGGGLLGQTHSYLLSDTFVGAIDTNNNVNDAIPPQTAGAVGPGHVVTMANAGVSVADQSGASAAAPMSLSAFFATSPPITAAYDPSIHYDAASGRWTATALSDPYTPSAAILLAVSNNSDPTPAAGWTVWSFDADANDVLYAGSPRLGVNGRWIVMTARMRDGQGVVAGNKMWVVDKLTLAARVFALGFDLSGGLPDRGVLVPARHLDDSAGESVALVNLYTDAATATVAYRLSRLTGAPGGALADLVWEPVPGSSYNTGQGETGLFAPPVGFDSTVPDASQMGTPERIESDSARIQSAVFRSGSLWFTHHAGYPQGTPDHAVIVWNQVNNVVPIQPPTSPPIVVPPTQFVQSGVIDGGSDTYFIFPSIAVNCRGDAAIGYTRTSSWEFPSAGFAARVSNDPPGAMPTQSIFRGGLSSYFRVGMGTTNWWGDHSAMCVDPGDDVHFWTAQQYAEAPSYPGGVQVDHWGIQWAKVAPCVQPTIVSQSGAPPACAGDTIRLWVGVSNQVSPWPSFRWQRNGVDLTNNGHYSGVSTPTLTITTSIVADSGSYRCFVQNACGGLWSVPMTLTVGPGAPPAPGSITAMPECGGNRISWPAVATATAYDVYRSTNSNGAGRAIIPTNPATGTSRVDQLAAVNTTYYYWVKARNDCGESVAFSPASPGVMRLTPLDPPTGISVASQTCHEVRITFNPRAGATSHTVYRTSTGVSVLDIQTATAIPTSPGLAVDTQGALGVTYRYWAVAHGCTPVQLPTPTSSVTAGRPLPPPPTGLSAVMGGPCSSMAVRWTPPAGVTSSRVYRSTTNNPASASLLATYNTAAANHHDHSVAPGVIYYYWVDSTAYDCTPSAKAGPAVGVSLAEIDIVLDPIDTTPIEGQPVTMSVVATGSGPLTFQWWSAYLGAPIEAITNGSTSGGDPGFQGATTATLTILRPERADNMQYFCRVSSVCGSVDSDVALLDRAESNCRPVEFNDDPSSRTICEGQPVTLRVETDGTYPITYAWKKNGVVIPGASLYAYSIPVVSPADAGVYTCVISNGCSGPVTSQSATLTVNPLAVLTFQPGHAARCAGQSVSFGVIATGQGPFSYQWRHDGVPMPGRVSPNLGMQSLTAANAGTYECIVTNPCGSMTSNAGSLTITTTPIITSPPASATRCLGESVTFSVTAAGGAVSYYWLRNGGPVPGGNASTLTIGSVSAADAGQYNCFITNPCGEVQSASAILTVPVASITSHPVGGTKNVGESITFTVAAAGPGPITYRWRFNGVAIAGATSPSLTIAPIAVAHGGTYDCEVINPCGTVVSNPAMLAVRMILSRGDFNGSGSTTVQDIFDFLGAYFAGQAAADFNGDGVRTVQDLFDFLGAYFAG